MTTTVRTKCPLCETPGAHELITQLGWHRTLRCGWCSGEFTNRRTESP